MISAWWLLLIVPVSVAVGTFFGMIIAAMVSENDLED